MIVNSTMFPVRPDFAAISRMSDRLGVLQEQLATGKRASSLSELGSDRVIDLTLRARLAAMDAYQQTITLVGLRLELMDQAMTRLNGLESETRADVLVGSRDIDGTNLPVAQFLAENRLSEAIELLNTDVNGRHLFAGNATEAPPVGSYDEVMNGSGGLAGFRQVLAERREADLGATGLGRVATSLAGTTVTLSEDGVHPFGFKLGSLAVTGGSLTPTGPAGSPGTLDVDFTSQPAAGDQVLIGLTLPDGSVRTLELTATDAAPTSPGEFEIGATAAATAANFQTALDSLLAETAQTELAAASAFAAADMFFAGSGETATRVDGPPYDSATALVAATDADTVRWYRGEDAPAPRNTVTARIDDALQVSYGVQANETGPTELVRSLAVLAADSVSGTDPNAQGFYAAVNARAADRLGEQANPEPGSTEAIAMDIAQAKLAVGRARDRHQEHKVALDTMVSEIEDVPPEEVAMRLVDLQTRLQASYETISIVSGLSLVNYLS
jgi:flagellar hook-associated protein 3 FlgL